MNVALNTSSNSLTPEYLFDLAARLPHMLELGQEIAEHEPRQQALMGIVESLVLANLPSLNEEEWLLVFKAVSPAKIDSLLNALGNVAGDTDTREIANLVFDHFRYVPERIGYLTQMESVSCIFAAYRFSQLVDYNKPINIAEILEAFTGRSVGWELIS